MTKKFFKGDSLNQLYVDVLREINDNPEFVSSPRGIETKEITNLSIELTNPYDRFVWNKAREVNYEFAMKFFLWMLNGDSSIDYVAGANKHAKEFIDQPKSATELPTNFSTAYGPRIGRQIGAIVEELKRDKDSRRAVIHVLEEADHAMLGIDTKEEYPCTDSFTFMIRDNKFHMYTHMRSNNMVLTICYDMFNMTLLQEFLFRVLKNHYPELSMGSYHHNIVSAHFFSREQPLVDKVLTTNEPWLIQKQKI